MIRGVRGFAYDDGVLKAGRISLADVARACGTPTYVYAARGIREAHEEVVAAWAPLGAKIHYAVKACSNLRVCRFLRELGAGMDVVSGGELERSWLAGTPMSDISFAGVGKTDEEIAAALSGAHSPLLGSPQTLRGADPTGRGPVGLFNVESRSELERIAHVASRLGVRARCAVRVNPDVDAKAHAYTSTGRKENKFGIDVAGVPGVFDAFAGHPFLELIGLHVHIGSQVKVVEPYVEAVEALLDLLGRLETHGSHIESLSLGGGWAVDYGSGDAPPIRAYAEAVTPLLAPFVAKGLQVILEPGRSLVAASGVLLTRVQHLKESGERRFAICDAGMHTLIRPALYQARHFIWPVVCGASTPPRGESPIASEDLATYDVVGPICETSDVLGNECAMPRLARGDLLAVFMAGAYGMTMTSNYNDRGRPAEVIVTDEGAVLVTERQTLADLLATEENPRPLDLD